MIIIDLLKNNANLYPSEIALVEINPDGPEDKKRSWRDFSLVETTSTSYYRRAITWGEFDASACRYANYLYRHGIRKGDKVGILLMNCLEWLPIYFGILKCGALAVPLNYRYTAKEIKYCLDLADVDMLVFGPEFIGRVESICDIVPRIKRFLYVGEGCPTFAYDFIKNSNFECLTFMDLGLTEDDDAAIYFSSGTTGFPKAILHKHRSLIHSCRVEQAHHGQKKEDVFLCIPPLYHTGAKMHWFGSLISASKAVLLKGTRPDYILEAVSQEKCTIIWLLVPWVQDLLDSIDNGSINLKNYALDTLRLMHIGAQPVPPSLVKRWKTLFPHHAYDTNYGLSESIGPGCVHLGVENEGKVGAIGVAGFGWETKIVNDKRQEVSRGEVGELAVRGPGVMTCYYKDEKATAEVLDKEGWLYTGDMAKEDEDGFIFLVDRKKDVIITGGENLYPVQIEDFLRSHPAIKDVAVIGLPHPRLGEIAAAIIEVKEGYSLNESEVNEFCMELPRYKRPRRIIFAKVPRNPTGKIEKPRLREIYCGESLVSKQIKG